MYFYWGRENVRKESTQWLAGLIIKKTGPVSYQVKLEDGKVVRCHQDQLRPRFTDVNVESQEMPLLNDDDLTMFTNVPPSTTSPCTDTSSPHMERCYPVRVHRPPIRYREGNT